MLILLVSFNTYQSLKFPCRDKTGIERHLASIRFPIGPVRKTKAETDEQSDDKGASETSKVQVGHV